MFLVGLDFGTTNCTMARPHGGDDAQVLRDAEGQDKTPSVVYFGPEETIVGTVADNLLLDAREDPDTRARVVRSIKRNLISPPAIALPGGRIVTPVEVVAEILGKLRRDAQPDGGEVVRAVVTRPARFDGDQASAINEAAALAGLEEVEFVAEPVAAAEAFAHHGGDIGQGVVICDYGGGTFDVAFVAREEGEDRFYLVLEPDGDARCGGDDLDFRLYEHFDADARRKVGRPIALPEGTVDPFFLRDCRRRKESLSKESRDETFSTMLDGTRFASTIDREAFEGLIAPEIDKTVDIVVRMAERARQDGYSVDTVLLVGGASRIPLIEQRLTPALGIKPQLWGLRDVAVALGAAYHANAIWGRRVSPVASPTKRYQRSVTLVWSDGLLEVEEARKLAALRLELSLSVDEAADIERAVMGRTVDDVLGGRPAADTMPARRSPAVINLLRRAATHHHAHRYDDAAAAFSRALELEEDCLEALTGRGDARYAAHQFQAALADFDRALELDPDNFRALLGRAQVNIARYRLTAAREDLDRALVLDPASSEALIARAHWHAQQDDEDAALTDFDRALAIEPASADAYVGRAMARADKHDSIRDADKALQLDPRHVSAHAIKAVIEAMKVDSTDDEAGRQAGLASADHHVRQALELDPDDPWALGVAALVSAMAENDEAAKAEADHALAINPDDPDLHLIRGYVDVLAGRLGEALPHFDRGLVLAPDKATLLMQRGTVQVELESYEAALADLDRALRPGARGLDADSVLTCLIGRGRAKLGLGRNEHAIADLTEALRRNSKSVPALMARAEAYYVTEPKRALADLAKARHLRPGDEDALEAWGHCLAGALTAAGLAPEIAAGGEARRVVNMVAVSSADIEGGWRSQQRQLLASQVTDKELLVWLCRCGLHTDVGKHVVLLLTDMRLLWVREARFKKAKGGSIPWGTVTKVDTLEGGFRLHFRNGQQLGFTNLSGSGVALSGQGLGLLVAGHQLVLTAKPLPGRELSALIKGFVQISENQRAAQ